MSTDVGPAASLDGPLDGIDRDLLVVVLDVLLPPDGDVPGAGGLGLDRAVRSGAREAPHLGIPTARALTRVPDDLADRAPAHRVDALRPIEREDADGFAALINLAYNAYYTDARVLRKIEEKTGYAARPPQPEGYELEPFDERLLDTVRQREPFWRDA